MIFLYLSLSFIAKSKSEILMEEYSQKCLHKVNQRAQIAW